MDENIQETILKSAKTALVDSSQPSDVKYHPKLIYNNQANGQIVLTEIENEFKKCE